ncbi:hypothetical protein CJ030_MR2G005637 [Morella rubra]|uniref:Uncharacterized protein n=1 Tax=Morella rubra TaxID=262757 RepID=A0A6A1WCB1_9ROSI|nr:hypothetical protein CJ030_MR4G026685 [Morella rubra]KAB1221318.1 hypothetical protein CJ030_MR2G005637 [Morella rubra]
MTQNKSHKGHKKSTPFLDPLHGTLSFNMSYMVESLKMLTERSNASASVQSSILATIEFLKLHMMKVVADVTLLSKHLNIAEKDYESGVVGPAEEPTGADKDLESFAKADDVEEEEEEKEPDEAGDSATSNDEDDE